MKEEAKEELREESRGEHMGAKPGQGQGQRAGRYIHPDGEGGGSLPSCCSPENRTERGE